MWFYGITHCIRESKNVKGILVYLSHGLISLHYLPSSDNTVMFTINSPHQRTVICGLIFVVGVRKLVTFILKRQFSLLIVNKPNIKLHICVTKDVKINACSEQTSNVMLCGWIAVWSPYLGQLKWACLKSNQWRMVTIAWSLTYNFFSDWIRKPRALSEKYWKQYDSVGK
jgi:hypothetical protein